MKPVATAPALLLLVLLTAGCASTVNTLPAVATRDAPTEELTLYLPEELEMYSVDYDAALYSDVSDGETTLGGRAFVKVYARHRETGVPYLLLYENIEERAYPFQIIRFEPDRAVKARR